MTTVYVCSSCQKTSLRKKRLADHVETCRGTVKSMKARVIPEPGQALRTEPLKIEDMTMYQKVPYLRSMAHGIQEDTQECIPYNDVLRRLVHIEYLLTRHVPNVFDTDTTFEDLLITVFRVYGGDLTRPEPHFTWKFDQPYDTNFCLVLDGYTTFLSSKDVWKDVMLETVKQVMTKLVNSFKKKVNRRGDDMPETTIDDAYTKEREHIIGVWKSIGKGTQLSRLYREMDTDAVWKGILKYMPVKHPVM